MSVPMELITLGVAAKFEDQRASCPLELGRYERQVELVMRTLRNAGYQVIPPQKRQEAA